MAATLGVASRAGAQTPIVTVEATDPNASEAGTDPGVFTFTRTGSTAGALTIGYTIGGTATNNGDYAFIPSSLTFAAGDAMETRTVTPINDALVEGAETVTVTLTDGVAYDLGASSAATVTIADNVTPVVTIQATDPDASEIGPDPGEFTFTRVGDLTFPLTVSYTIGGTATNNADYTFIPATIAFGAGEAMAVRTITPIDDALVEGPQTVVLTLQDGANYDVGNPGAATVTIADNVTPVITIAATDPDASEIGPDPGTFTFTRTGDLTFPLTVSYTIGGTATNNGDYAFIPGTVTFTAGETTATRVITPINDAIVEGSQSVVLTLQDGANYDVGAPSTAMVTIADNVTPVVTIEATDPNASEIGPDPGSFTFTRTGDLTFGLTVAYAIGGTATNNGDYAFIPTSVTFAPGEAMAVRAILPIDDPTVEGAETVVLTVLDGANYDVGAANAATVTIADNVTPVVTIAATDPSASEVGADPGTFTFTRVGDPTFALTVSYAIGGTATNNADYAFIPATVSFAAGDTTTTRTIAPDADALVEGPETVVLTLQNGANYDVGNPDTATVTIGDAPPPTTTTTSSTTSTTTTSATTTSTTTTAASSTSSTTTTTTSTVTTTTTTSTSTTTTATTSTNTTATTTTTTTSTPASTASLPASTTTLPGGCGGTPEGAGFVSVHCRIVALLERVNAESGLGSFQPKLAQSLGKARDRSADAQARCADGDLKAAKARLLQAKKALVQYAHRLKGRAAKKKLDATLRAEITMAGESITTDVTQLRAGLACPAGASS